MDMECVCFFAFAKSGSDNFPLLVFEFESLLIVFILWESLLMFLYIYHFRKRIMHGLCRTKYIFRSLFYVANIFRKSFIKK